MNALGITLTILVGAIILFIGFQFIYEYIWNKRLRTYQRKNNILHVRKCHYIVPVRRVLIALTSAVVLFVFIVTGSFNLPEIYREKTLLNATVVHDENTLRKKINEGNGFSFSDLFPGIIRNDSVDFESGVGEGSAPDVVGTNIQVEGVDEADIVKTDGYDIFYTPSYQSNRLYKYKVELDGSLTKLPGLEFDDISIKEFYLTNDYLVTIGYKDDKLSLYYSMTSDVLILPISYFWGYRYSSNVRVYDRDTLELKYELQTQGDIQSHRIIENTLYMVSYNQITKDELRPTFTETKDGLTHTSYVDYDSIIMFDNIPAYQITTVSALNLETYETHHETVVGVSGQIYMTKDTLYIAGTFSYYPFMNTVITGTHIIKFHINHEASSITYAGSTILEGFVLNQFWMDEYDGLLRVVTSRSWGATDKNRLYVLKENPENDKLEHYGLLDEGIGKPGERVTSVRFDKEFAYVVTYEQIDPLYTIDVSNPKDMKIINDIEEPGYNTYLHVWDDEHLVGIGYDENFNVKISVYQTTNTIAPLETYLLSQPTNSHGSWSYSEALNNHKAILISPNHGFVGFAVSKTVYDMNQNGYQYISGYYLFYIDFDQDPIIKEPYIIEHDDTSYANIVDRGIYINNIFYTFSSHSIVTFNGQTQLVEDTYQLSNPTDSLN